MSQEPLYCESLFQYHRNPTREVKVGNTSIGGDKQIQIQSMTTTNSLDADATAQQVIEILDAGADIVRITTQGRREARTLKDVRAIIEAKGYNQPLVADIHFNPNAAEIAAVNVEKVRINPGNFAGGAKKFEQLNFTDKEYGEELDIAREKLHPFLKICKDNGTAIRIGTNHGSLSDRIMSRYGDTPQGMVEACMEYLRLCREVDFHDIVLSIKASNTRIMVHTVRLLVVAMKKEGMNYPLHLGVTEAGSDDEGRIKSAVGSGALLVDGLGDTIRVSLTEDPVNEVPVASKLAKYICKREGHAPIASIDPIGYSPFEYNRRQTHPVLNIGNDHTPVIVGRVNSVGSQSPDYIMADNAEQLTSEEQKYILPLHEWEKLSDVSMAFPAINASDIDQVNWPDVPVFLSLTYPELDDKMVKLLKANPQTIILLHSNHVNIPVEQRAFIFKLNQFGLTHPVVIANSYQEEDLEDFQIKSAADAGILFLDGLADGFFLQDNGSINEQDVVTTAFTILQSARVRFTKTEFISCPGCGRTLFDLQQTTQNVKARTSHLKGLKIAVMGCIVNGVGEMADADYGYVGAGPDKVSLFKNRELVMKNLKGEEAVEQLIELIKENGDWVEPQ